MINKNILDSEVSLINFADIRKFVKECLNKAPDYFWKIPSSSTGKYHPEDDNIEGGLIRHTKKAVKIAEDLCRCFDVISAERDYVIAAMILHDTCKNGFPEGGPYTVDGHGNLFVGIVNLLMKKDEKLNSEMVKTISKLISLHMGRFDTPYIIGGDILSKIVHVADYISSRRYLTINL